MKKIVLLFVLVAMVLICGGCQDDAKVASANISKSADNFEINRRLVFYNSIADVYMLVIEGRLSIKKDNVDNQVEVIIKVSENEFKKHYLGLSDNVTYFSEQLTSADVDVYHYKVLFKPSVIIPDIDFNKIKMKKE